MLCRYERTIFKSDKGFCIFAYSTSDESVPKEARNRSYYHDDKIHFTAIGYHLIATDAVEVELDGTWENSKHGLQLSVSMCKEVVPRDQAGILAYLSSGIIKGIGPETAKAIVARFGDKTMEVLEKEPDKLLSVKGIAQKKLKAIIKSYGETKALSDLMIYLAPFGVSMKKVAMIREEFGDNSLRIVKTDPFQLCKIKGFGFMTVDSVARKTKVSLKHPCDTPVRSTMCWMRHAYLGIFFYPLMRRLASAMSFSIWAAMMKWFPKRKSAKRSQMNVWNPVSMLREAVYT